MIPVFIRAYPASAEIKGNRIVAFSDPTDGQEIAAATAKGDPFVGVSDRMGAPAGGMCDVHRLGLAATELGGAVQAGDPLTADAEGRAVKAEAAPGETVMVIGWADDHGVKGDIIDVFLSQSALNS